MEIYAVKTPLVQPGQPLLDVLVNHLETPLQERAIVCVTSKIVAVEQNRIVDLAGITPSDEAYRLNMLRFTDNPATAAAFAELVLREADQVFDGLEEPGFVFLTLKDNILVANAGIDLSNVPPGQAVLWPAKPWQWAADFRRALMAHYGLAELGVLLTDSHVKPLRRGVTGVTVAYSGFQGVVSEIGHTDIYGNVLKFTEIAAADSLAAAAVFMMGESAEQTPFAIINGAPVTFTDTDPDPTDSYFAPKYDLYAGIYNKGFVKPG